MTSKRRHTKRSAAKRERLIFKTAEIFADVAVSTLQRAWAENKPYLNYAFGVNAALATELYLKCLLLIECGQYPVSHNLRTLFTQLPRETRQSLKKKHDVVNRKDYVLGLIQKRHGTKLLNLDSLLETGQEVFEKWRYPFEPHAEDTSFGLAGLAELVRQRIDDEPTFPNH